MSFLSNYDGFIETISECYIIVSADVSRKTFKYFVKFTFNFTCHNDVSSAQIYY